MTDGPDNGKWKCRASRSHGIQQRMSPPSSILCVTTNKCPSAGSASNNTDAIQLLCPLTGSSLSNTLLRLGSGIGVQSLVPIPNTNAYLVYGGKDDRDHHAMLLIQGASSPSWRCRLAEPMTRFVVSPCGLYIVGAGKSGRCYCWSTFHHGELIRIWNAHYRQVNCICFSDCGSYLVTGGADGIVHVWSLMDILSSFLESSAKTELSINPIRTWSLHHLPITALHAMNSSRILSGSSDRQLIIMEIFSSLTLARIQVPTPISAITTDSMGHRLFIGGDDGRIFLIDLDSYAIATTAESATVIRTRTGRTVQNPTIEGDSSRLDETANASSYISELHGHTRAISCLTLLEGDSNMGDMDDLLISGGVDGTIRVWDVRARSCARILHPWNNSSPPSIRSSMDILSSCTSITIIPRSCLDTDVNRNQMGSSKRKNNLCMESAIMPLQRFTRTSQGNHDLLDDGSIIIPIRPMKKVVTSITFDPYLVTPMKQDKKFMLEQKEGSSDEDPSEEIIQLKKELQEARETIERWQKVNNKLAQRLKRA